LNFDELTTCIADRKSLANKTLVSIETLNIGEESRVIHFSYGKAPLVAGVVVRLMWVPVDAKVDFLP
jgi:hypothetical protein